MATDADVFHEPARDLEEELDTWALGIGRFLTHFASCERWTYDFIRTFGSVELRESVADSPLGVRGRIARAILRDMQPVDPYARRIEEAFIELTVLARSRNIVAHNGPMVQVYERQDGALFIRHELRSERDPARKITKCMLEDLAKRARALDEQFALLYGAMRDPAHRAQGTTLPG